VDHERAAWNAGANRNAIRTSSKQRSSTGTGASMVTPSASSTSAEPERDDSERLPCLATRTPAAAVTMAAMVDTLIEPDWSPPVPQVSTAWSGSGQRIGVARSRMVRAAPAISSGVSPFMRSPMSRAPICAGVASPSMMVPNTTAISSALRCSRRTTRAIACFRSI